MKKVLAVLPLFLILGFGVLIAQILPVNRLTHDNTVRKRQKTILTHEFEISTLPFAIPDGMDKEETIDYIYKLAKSGDKDAQYAYGEILLNGIGCDVNYMEANKWLSKSAKKGNAWAQFALGCNYFEGLGDKKDYKKSKTYFEQAAKGNLPEAQYNLYIIYSNGYAGEINNELASAYLFKAAQQEIPIAQYELAGIYYNASSQNGIAAAYGGGSSIPPITNPEIADNIIKHPKKDHSEDNLMANISFLNLEDKDYIKDAIKYLVKAAEADESLACNMLGLIYYNGDGVKKDDTKAVEYFEKGADLNNSESLYNLGWCYWEGSGVEKDIVKAKGLFERAASLGNVTAQKILTKFTNY